jgi:hypothetical protein
VTRVLYTTTLETETSGVLMTLDAIYHCLEASFVEVTFSAIHCAKISVRYGFAPTPTRPELHRVAGFPCKKCEGVLQVLLWNEGLLSRVKL